MPDYTEVYFGEQAQMTMMTHQNFLQMHYRALSCHCECMGMMSENMLSACNGTSPQFGREQFDESMKRWGLINDKGEVIL